MLTCVEDLVLPADHREALAEVRRRMQQRFGPRLRELRLFGSWARSEATLDSDIDVAVVVDDLDHAEWSAAIDDIAGVELSHDVVLGPFVVSTEHFADLQRRGRSLADAILGEGVAL